MVLLAIEPPPPPHHRSLCTHSGSGVGWDDFGDKGKSIKEFI